MAYVTEREKGGIIIMELAVVLGMGVFILVAGVFYILRAK